MYVSEALADARGFYGLDCFQETAHGSLLAIQYKVIKWALKIKNKKKHSTDYIHHHNWMVVSVPWN